MFNSFEMILILSIVAFLFGVISAPLSTFNSLRNHLKIKKPKWNEGIDEKNPLTSIQLTGYILIFTGISFCIGGLIFSPVLISIAITLFFAGIGCFTGIYLTFIKH